MRVRFPGMSKSEAEVLEGFGYYSQSGGGTRKKSWHNVTVLVGLVLLWYCGAVVTITTTKVIMNATKLPFLLCTVQFIFASVLARLYIRNIQGGNLASDTSSINPLLFQISVSYTFGFILTNTAFSIVSAAFAETVKASEPISTVAIGMLYLAETVSLRTYATLIPICMGVAFSCYHDDSFNMTGFVLAALSNVCFSSRAVLAKKLNTQYPDAIDDISMFAKISSQGLVFLVPITILFEGNQIVEMLYGASDKSGLIGAGSFSLLATLIVNGAMFAMYNLVSYLVLRRSDLITHSVLNAFRRVFIILFTTYYFNVSLTLFNMLGVVIAVMGVALFGVSKSLDKPKIES